MPSNFLSFAVPHNNCYTLLLENISFYFILQQIFLPCFLCVDIYLFLSSSSVSQAHYNLVYQRVCIWLQCVAKAVNKPAVDCSRLKHSMHGRITVLPYQAPGRSLAQEISVVCAGLHNKEIRLH